MFRASIRIAGAGAYLPRRVIKNEDICDPLHSEWAATRIGVAERRAATAEETTASMGAAAALAALEQAGLSPADVDVLFLATATPDKPIPPSVFEMADLVGLRGVPAFEIHAVCTGFLSAMICASQFLNAGGVKTALVVGSDRFTSITDWRHRDKVYFGDGAGAAVITRREGEANFFADLRHENRPKLFFREEAEKFFMDSAGLRAFGTERIPDSISALLKRLAIRPNEVDLVIPHQASQIMLGEILLSIDIDKSKMVSNIQRYGNTAAASIPIILSDTMNNGSMQSARNVLIFAVGAGMSWGSAVYINNEVPAINQAQEVYHETQ